MIVHVAREGRRTHSEKSANLKLFQVWLMGGSAPSCVIIASTWCATGIVWPNRMHGSCASGGGGGFGGGGGGLLQAFSQEAVSL